MLRALLLTLLIAVGAYAQSPEPMPTPSQFGGCLASGKVCFAPSLALTIAAVNLSKGTIEGAFSPGLGYGVTWNPGSWKSLGADLHFTVDPGAQQASISFLGALFNGYFRVGWSKAFINSHDSRLLIGTGVAL